MNRTIAQSIFILVFSILFFECFCQSADNDTPNELNQSVAVENEYMLDSLKSAMLYYNKHFLRIELYETGQKHPSFFLHSNSHT